MENQKSQLTWHAQSAKDVLLSFQVTQKGLSDEEVEKRLAEYGKNELPKEPTKSGISIFLSQLSSPLIAILIVAAFISFLFGEWLDVAVISLAVLLNTLLGFVEEYKADRSLHKLKSFLPDKARVRRGDTPVIMPANQVVPGDILLLNTGDKITADARIISTSFLQVSESALTGESAPVQKEVTPVDPKVTISDQTCMVFAGTVVVNGRAEAVVVSTGHQTEIGQISKLVSDTTDEKTPLQTQLSRFASLLGVFILLIASVVFVTGIVRGIETFEMFRIAVAVTVSAIPEGLAVATTVILAIGMQRILKKRALVRRLIAAETLGSVSVICMDKTGTLTTGEMSVIEIVSADGVLLKGEEKNEIKTILGVTSSAVIDKNGGQPVFSGSPTEIALAKEFWSDRKKLDIDKYAELSELPFDSATKYKAGVYRINGDNTMFVVGAPDILLTRADVSDSNRQKLESIFAEMTGRGLRVLLVAKKNLNNQKFELNHEAIIDLKVIGFVGFSDPLRQTAVHTIEQARGAGLIPIMITGDHLITASLVAREAGLLLHDSKIITGAELDELSDDDFAKKITEISVYARVLPRHKIKIVKAWQARGASVAMVGDGVNDAPAMKSADIGVALGSGTEVAKETAEIILLDNNFKTIVDAIREGRTIFDNIRKIIVYLLSDSFSEIILILGAILLGLPLPILPAQILWINLITDGFPSIALTFEPTEKEIMRDPPRDKKTPLLNSEMKILIFIIGLFTDLLLFGVYFYLLDQNLPIEEIRTFIFVALGLNTLVYIFAVRKFRTSIFRSNPFENKWLLVGVLIGFLFLLAPLEINYLRVLFDFQRLNIWEWGLLAGLAMIQLLLVEIVKEVFNWKRKNQLRVETQKLAL